MPLVMNSRDEEVTVRVYGNNFTFKPKQIKALHKEEMAHFLTTDKRELGFVRLPDDFEDLDRRSSPEGKALIEERRAEGIANYCAHLRTIVYNMEVSLRQDLEKSNIKADHRTFASDGEIKAMKDLVKYQKRQEDEDQKRVDILKDLEKQLKG